MTSDEQPTVFVALRAVAYEGDWVEGVATSLEVAQMIAEAEGEGCELDTVLSWQECRHWDVSVLRRWEARHDNGELVVEERAVLS